MKRYLLYKYIRISIIKSGILISISLLLLIAREIYKLSLQGNRQNPRDTQDTEDLYYVIFMGPFQELMVVCFCVSKLNELRYTILKKNIYLKKLFLLLPTINKLNSSYRSYYTSMMINFDEYNSKFNRKSFQKIKIGKNAIKIGKWL